MTNVLAVLHVIRVCASELGGVGGDGGRGLSKCLRSSVSNLKFPECSSFPVWIKILLSFTWRIVKAPYTSSPFRYVRRGLREECVSAIPPGYLSNQCCGCSRRCLIYFTIYCLYRLTYAKNFVVSTRLGYSWRWTNERRGITPNPHHFRLRRIMEWIPWM